MSKRLTGEELQAIRERAEKATRGNPLIDATTLAKMNIVIIEDIPKLLAEIERLKYAHEVIANSDGWLIEPAPLCTVEEAYDKCVEISSEVIYGGEDE